MEKSKIPIPYRPETIKFPATSTHVFNKEGVFRPIDPYGWITGGKVRSIEIGLPLIHNTEYHHPMDEAKLRMDKAMEIERNLMKSVSVSKKGENSNSETAKKATGRSNKAILQEQTTDVFHSIKKLRLKSVQEVFPKPPGANPFEASRKKRPLSTVEDSKPTIDLVKNQMKKVFNSGSSDFESCDIDQVFPTEKLYPPDTLSSKKSIESVSNSYEDDLDSEAVSLLIDPHEKDIFWTKECAPFTKGEIDQLYSLHHQSDVLTQKKQKQFRNQMIRRKNDIRLTFQSKKAFKKELELIEKEVDRITNIGPGKGMRNHSSLWSAAARIAENDTSAIPFRSQKWQSFSDFVSTNCYVKCESQQTVADSYRNELISGVPFEKSMFWRILDSLKPMDFQNKQAMLMIEFMRNQFQISSFQVIDYIDKRGIGHFFYQSAVDSLERKKIKDESNNDQNK